MMERAPPMMVERPPPPIMERPPPPPEISPPEIPPEKSRKRYLFSYTRISHSDIFFIILWLGEEVNNEHGSVEYYILLYRFVFKI